MGYRFDMPVSGKLRVVRDKAQSPDISPEEFEALMCMFNYARDLEFCRLAQAKAHAVREGFSIETVDNATRFWAHYHASK